MTARSVGRRHAEIGRQPALGRQRVADLQLVEHPQDLVADQRLLAGAPVGVRDPGSSLSGAGSYQLVN